MKTLTECINWIDMITKKDFFNRPNTEDCNYLNSMKHHLLEELDMDKEITSTTTSVAAMSGIPWKKVRKLVNDSIAAGANVDISCDADGSWNIAIYPPEKQEKITVPETKVYKQDDFYTVKCNMETKINKVEA